MYVPWSNVPTLTVFCLAPVKVVEIEANQDLLPPKASINQYNDRPKSVAILTNIYIANFDYSSTFSSLSFKKVFCVNVFVL